MNHFKDASKPGSAGHLPKSRGKQAKRSASILFHAGATDPDMLYFSRFNALDPYLAFSVDGRRVGVTTAGEYGRMVKESCFDEILLLDEVRQGAARRFELPKGKKPSRVFEGDPFANETKEQRDARMAWWREAKFGMFIHWGVYAVLAGEYKDTRQ